MIESVDERRLALERRLAELSPAKRALLERGNLDTTATVQESPTATISRRATGMPVPMSFAQELIWTLERTNPGHAYNLSRLSRLKGPFDLSAMQLALDALVVRHEMLRTTFAEVNGEPLQVVNPPAPVPITLIDLSAIEEAGREDEAVRCVRELTRRPFDLAHDLQLRCTLLRLAPEDHVLLLESHHVATDGWSRGILLRELTALYDGFRSGAPAQLPELPIQYGDYAAWQRESLQGDTLERLLAYWRKQLVGAPPMLELPLDRPRPAGPSFEGAKRTLWLPPELLEQLRALSQAHGVTLFMTLLAAFDVLLARYSGESDILVGSPVAGRTHPETHGVMGYFINTLVMRTSIAGDPTVAELLGRVRDVCLGAYEHQEVPFEKLVADLQREQGGRAPLLQSTFTLHDPQLAKLEIEGTTVLPLGVATTATKFDLALFTEESPRGLRTAMEYRAELFDPTTIDRMLAHYRAVLESMVARPEVRVSKLPILPADERAALLDNRQVRLAGYRSDLLVSDLVAEQVAKTPDAIAVVADGSGTNAALTYAELDAQSNRLAWELRRLGVRPDIPVGLFLERTPALIVTMLAVLKAGGAYLPLDPAFPAERLRFMLDDAAPAVIVTEERLRGQLAGIVVPQLSIDGDAERIARHSGDRAPETTARQDSLAYILFTSGSTGRPKGVMVSHAAISHHTQWIRSLVSFGIGDTVLQKTPVTFDPSGLEIYLALATGARLLLARPGGEHDLEYVLDVMQRERVTMVIFIPSALAASVHLPGFAEACSALRLIISGGEVLTSELAARTLSCAPDGQLFNLYGPTEATIAATAWRFRGDEAPGPLPIGRPLPELNAYIVDKGGELAPFGVAGELCISGVQVARGYLNRPETTADRFVEDPFAKGPRLNMYRTGDRARWRADGVLEFLGRVDEQVKIRGYRIEPEEIEAVLASHPAVAEAAVIAREDVPGSRRLVAYVTVAPGMTLGTLELREFARRSLPEYMVPAAVMVLDQLPLNVNGKLDRDLLPVPDSAEVATEYVAPRNDIEGVLAEVWAEVLSIGRVGVHDDFFDLGGHSLLALRVFSRLVDRLHVRLPLRTMFEAPTVAKLAERIVSSEPATSVHAVEPIPRIGDEGPASFAQEVLWLLQRSDPELSAYNMADAWSIEGALDLGALQQALNALVERHASMRTTFHQGDSGLVQRIAPARSVAVELLDLCGMAPSERDAGAAALVRSRVRRPFDLGSDLLLRVTLIQVDASHHVLVMVTHHVASDGWSRGVVIHDLSALYTAFARGAEAALSPMPVRFIDYAAWQHDRLRSGVLSEHLEYWSARLAGATLEVGILTDRPRLAEPGFTGASESRRLPMDLLVRLHALAREHDATLFMVLLAAYQVALHRYGAQEDLVVGTVVAGRSRSDLEQIVGYFVNTLPIRTSFEDNPTFATVLDRVREAYLGASEHADVPFQQLVTVMGPGASSGADPVCQAMFVHQNNAPASLCLGETTSRSAASGLGAAKFDLMLATSEQPDGLRASMQYRPELFDATTMQRFLGHLGSLLTAIVETPGAPIATIPLLDAAERHQVLDAWNATATKYPADETLLDLLDAQAKLTPEATAVEDESGILSYAELHARADDVAAWLRLHGVGPGALVAVCLERSTELVAALVGVIKAGAAYVPIDPDYPADRLAFMLEDAGASVLITQQRLAGSLPEHAAVCLVIDSPWPAPGAGNPSGNVPKAGPTDPVYMIYTSGSTGRPKGAINSHRGIVNRLRWMQGEYRLTSADVVLQKTPASFDVSVWEFFWPLIAGARLVMAAPGGHRDPSYLADTIKYRGVTVLHFVPSMLAAFLDEPMLAERCGSVRDVICSGEALASDLTRRFFARLPAARLHNLYGPTEAAVDVSFFEARRNEDRAFVPIGRPVANTHLYVLDTALQPAPIGVPGELYIGGAQVGLGYHRRPELTAERFVIDPFAPGKGARMYRTGDRARWLVDGTLEFLGRLDYQVKLRGQRIELGDIESQLLQQAGVTAALAMVRADRPGDDRLVAYVVADGVAELSATALRAAMRSKLPEVMVPTAFIFLDQLPLTPSGKVDRKALPAPAFDSAARAREFVAPQTPLEIEIATMWSTLLNVGHVGLHDDFFDLGGSSLLAMRMIAEIERMSGRRLPFRSLLEHPTVGQIATILGSALREDEDRGVAVLQAGGSGAPLAFVHGDILGFGWYCRRLAPLLGPAPLIVIQTYGRDALLSFEQMAAANIDALKRVQPAGPYRLGGFCQGGLIAYEMARQLVARGDVVEAVIAVDALCPNARLRSFERLVRWRSRSTDAVTQLERRANLYMRLHYYRRRLQHIREMRISTRMGWAADVVRRVVGLRRPAPPPSSAPLGVAPTGQTAAGMTTPVDQEAQSELERVWKFRFVRRAQRAYMPGSYHGRVDVVLAGEVFRTREWARRGGGLEHVASDVHVHQAAGTHDGLIMAAGLPALAAQIRQCLDR